MKIVSKTTAISFGPVGQPLVQWYACAFPERPSVQGATLWHLSCRACAMKLEAERAQRPDDANLALIQGISDVTFSPPAASV